MKNNVTVLLGNEYDKELFNTLNEVLKFKGASIEEELDGIGGSQELSVFKVKLNDYSLIVELETYIGLTINGNKTVINNIVKDVYEKLNIKKPITYI